MLAVPAFAITESEVEAQVSATGRESVTGNVLIWFLCAVAFLKVSQKIDSFMASMGVNVGHTGGSMLAEAMIAFRGVSTVAGLAGHAFGGGRHSGGSTSPGGAPGPSGGGGGNAGWFLKGGLAGAVSRKFTSDAVKQATTTKTATHTATASARADHIATATTAAREEHTSTAEQTASAAHTASSVHTAGASHTASSVHTAGTSHTARESSSAQHTRTAETAKTVSHTSSQQHGGSIGGAVFLSSLHSGGRFANDVIGMVAQGDIRSTGSITGDMASQAMMSYMGYTALGEAASEKIAYSDVEIGGGRITGTEITPEHPQGIAFGMYQVEQYAKPEGDFSKVFTADGAQWYKQYAVDTVVKTPIKAPDGEIDYAKEIVKRLPNPPKRKDRM